MSRPQYFYNIFTINHTWLVISWKNLWQTNCGNGIAEIGRKKKFVLNCGNAIAEIGRKKKICFGNCGNSIAENEKKKTKFVLAIVAVSLPKMEKKKICFGNCGNDIVENGEKKMLRNLWKSKKKKLSRPQYFYNKSHVINYY